MNLGEILQNGHIVERLQARNKEEAIAELVDVLVRAGDIDGKFREDVLVALLKREALSGTVLGEGIAVPHASVKFLPKPLGVLGISPDGVTFTDSNAAHLIFLLLSSERDPDEHLKWMAFVSRLAEDPAFVRHLREADSRPRITRLLREAEKRFLSDPPPTVF